MNAKANNILWLPSWYPNPTDPFEGDFIQRHAHAAALQNNIHVLFIKPIPLNKPVKEFIKITHNLTEQIIYINKEKGFLKKVARQQLWLRQYKEAIKAYILKNGLPHLVHVHVPWRVGVVALWMKRKFGIPYVITEHWGIYNNVVENRFSNQPFWMRYLLIKLFNASVLLVSVSEFLAKNLNQYGIFKKFVVIPNVVDTTLFYYKAEVRPRFTFVHISNMVLLKNVYGLLDAFALFHQQYKSSQLVLIGNKDDHFINYANSLKIERESCLFLGEIPYTTVAAEMQSAHCLILNSDMENSPCVIGEALCCGLPVIATNVGGIPELTNDENSILIPPRDTQALIAAMSKVYDNYKKINRNAIADAASKKHNYGAVAAQLTELYNTIC